MKQRIGTTSGIQERLLMLISGSSLARLLLLCITVVSVGCASHRSGRDQDDRDISGTESDQGKLEPEDIMVRAQTAQRLGKADEALYHYVSLLEVQPKNADALIAIGEIHLDKGNPQLANVAFLMAIDSDLGSSRAYEGNGLAAYAMHEDALARTAFENALKRDPTRWRALNGLGLLADRSGHHQEAIGYFQRALTQNPKNPQVLNNLGYSRYLVHDYSGALKEADAALRIKPSYSPAIYNRALYLARMGRVDEAIEAFRGLTSEADAYNNLGYVFMKEGDLALARDYLEKAVQLSPTYHRLANENLRQLDRLIDRQAGGESALVSPSTVSASKP